MIRTALFAVFALTVITAGIAMAGEAGESSGTDETGGTGDPAAVVEVKAPCMDKANQEALDACLQRVLDEGLKIVLPTCEDESGAALTGTIGFYRMGEREDHFELGDEWVLTTTRTTGP